MSNEPVGCGHLRWREDEAKDAYYRVWRCRSCNYQILTIGRSPGWRNLRHKVSQAIGGACRCAVLAAISLYCAIVAAAVLQWAVNVLDNG